MSSFETLGGSMTFLKNSEESEPTLYIYPISLIANKCIFILYFPIKIGLQSYKCSCPTKILPSPLLFFENYCFTCSALRNKICCRFCCLDGPATFCHKTNHYISPVTTQLHLLSLQ